jgi:hypothetical protein
LSRDGLHEKILSVCRIASTALLIRFYQVRARTSAHPETAGKFRLGRTDGQLVIEREEGPMTETGPDSEEYLEAELTSSSEEEVTAWNEQATAEYGEPGVTDVEAQELDEGLVLGPEDGGE